MAFTCGFFNSQNGDRKYNAEQMASIFDGLIKDGVYDTVGDIFAVTPGTGMQVLVGSGRAWFDHTWNNNDAPYPLAITAADVSLPRYDAVVLETNHSDTVRTNRLRVLTGTPASNPVKPTMTSTANVKQHPLAYIKVTAGATSITQSMIQVVVGTSECPFVTGIIETAQIDALFQQWNGEFNEWFENLKAQLSDNVVANLQGQIDQKVAKADVATTADIEAGTSTTKWVSPKGLKDSGIDGSPKSLTTVDGVKGDVSTFFGTFRSDIDDYISAPVEDGMNDTYYFNVKYNNEIYIGYVSMNSTQHIVVYCQTLNNLKSGLGYNILLTSEDTFPNGMSYISMHSPICADIHNQRYIYIQYKSGSSYRHMLVDIIAGLYKIYGASFTLIELKNYIFIQTDSIYLFKHGNLTNPIANVSASSFPFGDKVAVGAYNNRIFLTHPSAKSIGYIDASDSGFGSFNTIISGWIAASNMVTYDNNYSYIFCKKRTLIKMNKINASIDNKNDVDASSSFSQSIEYLFDDGVNAYCRNLDQETYIYSFSLQNPNMLDLGLLRVGYDGLYSPSTRNNTQKCLGRYIGSDYCFIKYKSSYTYYIIVINTKKPTMASVCVYVNGYLSKAISNDMLVVELGRAAQKMITEGNVPIIENPYFIYNDSKFIKPQPCSILLLDKE